VKKEETLRGRGAFSSLFEQGTKLDSGLLRCFFRYERGAGTPLRAGFSVSSRTFNAVKRNRIRRLMRAAFDAEAAPLRSAAGSGVISMAIVFRGRPGYRVERLPLAAVRNDMRVLCRECAARVSTDAS
jgi:ribonuclease P protein component